MYRDFIVVYGNQGFGKSVWRRQYTKAKERLLLYDPLAEDATVDYTTDPQEWAPSVIDGTRTKFRYGTFLQDDLPLFGSMAFAAGECCFCIEEAGTVFERGRPLDDYMREHVFMGRHPRVDLIIVAQRAASVPIDVRSQAQRIVTFRQTEPDDVDALLERLGDQITPDEILNLPELNCIDRDMRTGEIRRYAIAP